MRIARELAGYSLGEADLLRRAMGKKIPAEMAAHREKFIEGARREREIAKGVAETDLRAGGEIRRLRLQQGPRRRLCAGRLSDGVSEGELSGRIPRRVDDARYRQHRPAQRLPPGSAAAGHSRWRRRTSTAREAVLRLRCGGGRHLLRAGRREGRRPAGDGACRRGAQSGRAVHQPRRFRRRVDPQAGQQARLRKSGARRRLRCAQCQPPAAGGNPPTPSSAARGAQQRERESGQATLFGESAATDDDLRLAPCRRLAGA